MCKNRSNVPNFAGPYATLRRDRAEFPPSPRGVPAESREVPRSPPLVGRDRYGGRDFAAYVFRGAAVPAAPCAGQGFAAPIVTNEPTHIACSMTTFDVVQGLSAAAGGMLTGIFAAEPGTRRSTTVDRK